MYTAFPTVLFTIWFIVASCTANSSLRATGKVTQRDGPEDHDSLNSTDAVEHQLQETLLSPRIIGGTTARQGQYPYYVQWNGCGATLIHSDIVLTAAHCNVITSNTVIVGAYKYYSVTNGAVERTVTARRVHPSYNTGTQQFDYLVLKLDSPVSLRTVKLNSNRNIPTTNQQLTVIGMGITTRSGATPSFLQQVNVNYVDPQSCAQVYDSTQVRGSTTLCALSPQGNKDSCQGDSGGPILDSSGTQVGITSFGFGCAVSGYPGVYARITGALPWINQQICALSSNPPSSCSTSSSATVRVDILYDNRPAQTSWTITNPYGAVKATSHGYGTAGKVKSSYVRLPKGTYLFTIKDSGNNGICCQNGNGKYTIYASYAGRLKKLAFGNGVFKGSQQIKFVV